MGEISLFVPCMVDLFMPVVAESSVQLLRRLGSEPVYHREQTCCGQPAINAGYFSHARSAARHFIEVFGDDEAVVCPSGSCVYTVKNRYPQLFEDEPEWRRRSEELAGRVYELTQYLVDVCGAEDVGAVFEGKVAYHPSCQLTRGLGVSEQPRKLIGAVGGTELVPLDKEYMCCGFGGEFANDYPELSEALVSEKVESYLDSGADLLVACEPGCLLNIGGYLSRHHPEKKAMHIAQFLVAGGPDRTR
jgi:L-lactate dehydrogenase complex protein LldE